MLLRRNLTDAILDALADTPVVFLAGARQVGKSTLAESLAEGAHPARYLTLDDAPTFAAAQEDPQGFVAALKGPAVIDEVQRVPELFRALKLEVDRDRRPGRFLLTGSSNVLLLPRLADELVGRMEVLELWPFSQGELEGHQEGFLDAVFARKLALPKRLSGRSRAQAGRSASNLVDRVARGGYPMILERKEERRRRAWFGAYVTTVAQRDIRDVSDVDALGELQRLLALLAARVGTLLNASELSRSSGIPLSTLRRYLALLETTFLVQMIPAWSANLGKRIVRSPKVLLTDTGLAAAMQGAGAERLRADPSSFGRLLEGFVAMELRKQVGWSLTRPTLHHFRTHAGLEVDLILEEPGGGVVGLEVKATSTPRANDVRGLRALEGALGERFVRGILFHTGGAAVGFGDRIVALPVEALWELEAPR